VQNSGAPVYGIAGYVNVATGTPGTWGTIPAGDTNGHLSLAQVTNGTQSTLPVCPNGRGGTLTTNGCTSPVQYNISSHVAWIASASFQSGEITYLPLGASGAWRNLISTSATVSASIATAATTLGTLYVRLTADPGNGNTVAFTVYDNNSASSVACAVRGNGGTGIACSDTTHTLSVKQGDLLSFAVMTTGTIASDDISVAVSW
jgi:hypothetical protein